MGTCSSPKVGSDPNVTYQPIVLRRREDDILVFGENEKEGKIWKEGCGAAPRLKHVSSPPLRRVAPLPLPSPPSQSAINSLHLKLERTNERTTSEAAYKSCGLRFIPSFV